MPPNSEINRAASINLLKLALALHRGELVIMPDAGHTDSILLLLRIANGDSELMTWATAATGADAEELRASCVAFVERVCFNGDSNPFGVLGLNPWANAEAVKEHYRLLIRIFHPDRGQVSNATAQAYSARINQAYALLKQQVGEDVWNQPKPAATNHYGQTGTIARRFTRPPVAANNSADSLRWASKLTPAKVLFGMALLAGLIIYFSFPQKMRMQSSAPRVIAVQQPIAPVTINALDAEVAVPEVAVPEVAVPEVAVPEVAPQPDAIVKVSPAKAVADVVNEKIATPKQPPKLAESAKVESTPPVKKTPAKPTLADAAVQKTVSPVESIKVAQPAVIVPVPASGIEPDSIDPRTDKKQDMPVIEVVQAAEVNESPVLSVAELSKPVGIPSENELHDLIMSFMTSYANGDINAFMRLFDEQVRSDESGGKPALHSTYARFFAKTVSRSVVLKNLQWQRQGDLVIGRADYRVSSLRADDTQAQISLGTLQIEVAKISGKVMIAGFFYEKAKK